MQYILADRPKLVKQIAQTAIDAHLYIDGWSLIDILNDAIIGPKNFRLAAAFTDEGKMVGIACMEFDTYVSTFVLPEYRRQGVATEMFKLLKVNKYCECCLGEPQSKFLFEKFDLLIHDA